MAAKYDVGARIGIEGEQSFNASIKAINAGLSTLDSELKLTKTQFEGQEHSVEALTKAQDVLERTLYSQKDKVSALEAELRKSAQTFGESSAHTMKLQKDLNNANAALIQTERKLKDTTGELTQLSQGEDKAQKSANLLERMFAKLTGTMKNTDKAADDTQQSMKELDENGKGLGDVLNNLGGKFGVSLPNEMTQSINKMGMVDAKTLALVGGFAALVTAIVKVEKALIDMTKASAAYADEIITMSAVTGIATESLQEYTYAAELLDVSVDTITGSQTKLIRSMQMAKNGTDEQVQAFDKLGVAYRNTDGTLRNSEDVFWDAIDALGRMTNETERDAVAMTLMGKSAQDLNPLIKAGSSAMTDFAKEAKQVGYVLSKDDLEALGKVDDAMQRFNKSTEAAKNQLAVQFAPYLEDSTKKLTEFVTSLGKALKDSGMVDAFGMLLNTFVDIIAPADELADDTVPSLTESLRPLAQMVAAIADTMDFIHGLLTLDFGKMGKALGFGYSYGNGNNIQTLREQWGQTDINAATQKAGYGQYYANGKWYSNYDEYLRSVFGGSNFSGTFEAWKNANGYNAAGNQNWRGGVTWVGENGPEKVYLPQGSEIMTAQESRNEGNTTIYVTIDAKNVKEFNDIVKMAETARMNARKEKG